MNLVVFGFQLSASPLSFYPSPQPSPARGEGDFWLFRFSASPCHSRRERFLAVSLFGSSAVSLRLVIARGEGDSALATPCLPPIPYPLSTSIPCSLSPVPCPLFPVPCSLSPVPYSLSIPLPLRERLPVRAGEGFCSYCSPFTVHCSVFTVHLLSVLRTPQRRQDYLQTHTPAIARLDDAAR